MSRSGVKHFMQDVFSVWSQMCGTTVFLLSFLSSVLCSSVLNAGGAAVRALLEKMRSAVPIRPELRNPLPRGWRPVRYVLEGVASGLVTLGTLFLLTA